MRIGVLVLVALGGCFTARAAVGPHLSTRGHAGLTAAGGIGLGLAVHGRHAIYATPTFGVIADGGPAHAIGYDSFDYVYTGDDARPVRLSARLGAILGRGDEPDRAMFGAAVAYFPWGGKTSWANAKRSGGDDCEKSCFDLDFFPTFGGIAGLGVEFAVDTTPAASSATVTDRSATMATISLVAQGDLVIDL